MAHPGLTAGLARLARLARLAGLSGGIAALGVGLCAGCAAASSAAPSAAGAGASEGADGGSAGTATFEQGRWGTFASRRFELRLPLPDGAAWRIDDHRTPWLRAEHAATGSTVVARVWSEAGLPTRERCYEQARVWDATLPDWGAARVIDDAVRPIRGAPDARVVTGLEPAAAGATQATTAGFVLAAAAVRHKCVVFAFRTRSADPEQVAARLAVVTQRLVPSVEVESALSAAPPPMAPRLP